MHLSHISLANFNNYGTAETAFHAKMNTLTGLNGMGKTNMLDAVYYLCLGKSYFSSTDRYVLKRSTEFFRAKGVFETDGGKETVEIKVNPGNKKEIIYSGKKRAKLSDHIGALPCVIIAPIDIQLMLEGSEQRRKFLDNTIMQFDKEYVANILSYNRLLKQRNAMLKTFAEKHFFDMGLLESLSVGMYEKADFIHKARKRLVEGLEPLFVKYYGLISGDHEKCEIGYKSQMAEKSLEELFTEHIEKDKILTRTSAGIHKDDIDFKMNDVQLKNFASQGQLKSFVLALKLSQYEMVSYGSKKLPILILDDIFDKLDKERVARLLGLLSAETFGQIFISDTNADRVPNLLDNKNIEYQAYNVFEGEINNI